MPARIATLLAACALAAALLAAGAAADGGPSPGVLTGEAGVLAPDGASRYVVLPAGPRSALASVSTRDGRVLRYRPLKGAWGIPLVAFDGSAGGLSADGRTLVLASVPTVPFPRTTRFAVLDAPRLRLRQTVALRGSFSFDALSPDARTLYVIQHLSESDLFRYVVRALDLRTGRLGGAIVDKREAEEQMSGYPVTRATSRDGRWVYTLYRNDEGHPFVHALDAVHAQAICIDLPWHGSQDGVWQLRLRLSAGEAKLLVTRAGKTVATIDRGSHRLLAAARE
jgi:hypothetical protein